MSDPPQAAANPYRWTMLGGIWLIYVCFGLITAAMAPLIAPIKAELGIGNAVMGSVLGAWPLVYIFSALPCGILLDRIGVRWGVAIGAVVIALSCLLRALADDYVSMFAAVAVFGIAGPLVSIGAPKVIGAWFEGKDRGFAMGAYMTGPALGGVAAFALTNSVAMPLAGGDWRLVLAAYAGVALLSAFVWLAITAHPASRKAERERAGAGEQAQMSAFLELLRIPVVRIILAMSILTFFFGHGISNWLPEILRTGGMSPIEAGYWSAVPTLVGIAAALIIPRLAVPSRRLAVIALLLISGAAATLLIESQTDTVRALGLIFQGITRGTLGSVVILLLMETGSVSPQKMGAAGGLYFTAGEIGGVLGPLSVGALAEVTGGFTLPLYMLTTVCVILLFMLAWLRRVSARSA